MKTSLIFDLSNVAYISAFRVQQHLLKSTSPQELVAELTLKWMRELYRQFKPDQVFFACDHHEYWRKQIYPAYKAHRPEHALRQHVKAAIAAIKQQHPALCLEVPLCEADDIIYGLTHCVAGIKILVSSDTDFVQLIDQEVKLFNPMTQLFRTQRHPKFGLFVKCFRGDRADNIPSAYPRVSERILKKAFSDVESYEQLMQVRLSDGRIVRETFEFNRQLMDLSRLPILVRESLFNYLTQVVSSKNIM